MRKVKSKLRMWLSAVCASLFVLAMSFGLVACGSKDLKIDVPERIEEDLGTGTYVVPHYDVVNAAGVIMAGYNVRLKSVTDPNGEAAEISREASTIVTLVGAGEYTFVYTADSNNVVDATVIMDFADRTAPTIKLASSQFPAFFIQGVTYAVPEYTLSGDFLASRCYTKVFYNDGQETEDEEVKLEDGYFTVEHASGKYTVLIHVEDASGNGNDYRYTRSVSAPEHYDPETVVYFNEAFGEKQVVSDEGSYAGKFVSVADGGKAYGNEAGSYKIEFNGSETNNNEAYFAINVPAIANVMAYKELEMYVYIEDEDCANGKTQWVVGSKWWNDTRVQVGKWTRVTWSVEEWGGIHGNSGANGTNIISTDNISGTRIRLVPDADYDKTTPPHGTVYFSAMRVVPYELSQVTAGENVTLDKRDGSYRIGDTVTLTANEIKGKTFDCFLVNGKPISGNTFTADKETYAVEVKYVEGKLTADNMTWGETESYRTEGGGDAKVYKLGTGTHWVLTYQPAIEQTGWVYTAAYVGGANQLFGIEMHSDNDSRKLSGYGGAWAGDVAIPVSEAVRDALRASKTAPVTMIYIRNGETISAYLRTETDTVFLGSVKFSVFQVSGDGFGIGERSGTIQNAPLKNIKWVVGEERTNLYLGQLTVTFDLGENVTTEKNSYQLGETVTLVHTPAEQGYIFSHYTVDGNKIEGNSFVATKMSYTVAAVFTEISELTLGEGVTTSDGETRYARGVQVRLSYDSSKLNGKVLDYYLVDQGTANAMRVYNGAFITSSASHTVKAVLAEPSAMTWANGGANYGYETVMGDKASEWKARALDGEVYGSAEYWAVSVDVKFTKDWRSFEFIQGATQSIRVRFHEGGYCGVLLMTGKTNETKPSPEFMDAYPNKNVAVVNKLLAGATVTCVRNGNTITMYADGYLFFTTNYAVDHTGNWFGVGHVTGNDATKPEMSNTKFITGQDKIEAYLAAFAASDKAPKSETQINGISGAKITDGTANLEYVNEIPAGLSDANIKESGVLKVDATNDELQLNVDFSFVLDLAAYEEVYFWVYTEDEGVQAGTKWCADTNVTAGTWTKVTVTRDTNYRYDGGIKYDGVPTGKHGNPYDANNSSSFVFRIMKASGKTVYVTSLYGVPKTAE